MPYTPIELIYEPPDPWGKDGRAVEYARFQVAALGPLAIEGLDCPIKPQWVRLPLNAEPGMVYELVPDYAGGVMMAETKEGHLALLDAPRVLVADDLCVWLLQD